jgi:hypothetical protein
MAVPLPTAVWQSKIVIGGKDIRVYVLEDGRRIVDADDLGNAFAAGAQPCEAEAVMMGKFTMGHGIPIRTPEEIVAKIREKKDDLASYWRDTLLPYLPFELAKEFLILDTAEEQWKGLVEELSRESILEDMSEYMPFAWDKAARHSALSAARTIDRMQAWCWLIHEDHTLDWNKYRNYGAPILLEICKKFAFDVTVPTPAANMALGQPCREGCNEGCA